MRTLLLVPKVQGSVQVPRMQLTQTSPNLLKGRQQWVSPFIFHWEQTWITTCLWWCRGWKVDKKVHTFRSGQILDFEQERFFLKTKKIKEEGKVSTKRKPATIRRPLLRDMGCTRSWRSGFPPPGELSSVLQSSAPSTVFFPLPPAILGSQNAATSLW